MKLFSPITFILFGLAATAAVVTHKDDRRAAPENDSRTVVTDRQKPAAVTGVEERGDRYFLSGKNGPIAVPLGVSLWDAIDQVRLEGGDLPQDPFAIGLVPDPDNPAQRLVVAWKPLPPKVSVGQP